MGFLIKLLLIFSLFGAAFGYLKNGKTRAAAGDGAAKGILFAAILFWQFFSIGILALAGIWLVTHIF